MIFAIFLTAHCLFYFLKVELIMFRFSPELKQLRYEEIFRLSVTVTDKQAFTFLYFTVYGNSVMTCIKNVRYHCGGWSEEVNSCILILSYMVYL
jgi:hypothetical protein